VFADGQAIRPPALAGKFPLQQSHSLSFPDNRKVYPRHIRVKPKGTARVWAGHLCLPGFPFRVGSGDLMLVADVDAHTPEVVLKPLGATSANSEFRRARR
jgi:hypothetical protein